MSPQQIASLRQNSPFKYLKFLVNARNHSINGGSSTSTALGNNSSLGTQEEILGRLKVMLFHVDLISHLAAYPFDGAKIKDLLKKVDVQIASP